MHLKNIGKRILVTCFAMALCLGYTTIPAQASYKGNQEKIELEKGQLIMGDMALRRMTEEEFDKIESGEVEALEFETIEDFYDYMNQRRAQTIDITNNINIKKPTIQTYALSDISQQFIGVDPIPVPPVYINCQFNYTSTMNSSGQWVFASITNIQSWLSGIQFPVNYSWEQKSGVFTYSNNKRNVRITVSGVLGTHIIIESVGHILDQNMTYSFDYTARQ